VRKKKIGKAALIAVMALFVIFSAGSFVFIKVNFDKMFARSEKGEYSAYLHYEDVAGEVEREELSFDSHGNTLKGYLYGQDHTDGLVVISHGLGGGAESYFSEAMWFAGHGYQVFSYDNTGCHESGGKNCVGLSQSVIDLDAALSYIEGESRFDGLPVYLYGHSWGGYAVTAVLNYDHEIAASASVSGFNKPMDMILEWTEDMMGGVLARIEQPYIRIYQQILFGKNANLAAVDGINRTDIPVLLIHGDQDDTVTFDGAGTIAYRDEITNPNVQYKVCDGEKQNDHNWLYMSRGAIDYLDGVDKEYEKLSDKYEGSIPEDIRAEFYSKIDKQKASELDETFMQDVLEFYRNAKEGANK